MLFVAPTGGPDALTVYQVGEAPTPEPELYEELGCAADPNPGVDGGRVRDRQRERPLQRYQGNI